MRRRRRAVAQEDTPSASGTPLLDSHSPWTSWQRYDFSRLKAPDAYINWINAHLGFNPRSQQNSNALSDFVTTDLRRLCPQLARHFRHEVIEPAKNANVRTKVTVRNVDLVFQEIQEPHLIVAAVEHKTIMAAHGKARKNRYGDIIAYCNHMHNHRRDCIAAATVVINCCPIYENPDAFAKGLVRPKFKMPKIVADTVQIFADIPLRTTPDEPNDQPEAMAVIVVDYDGAHPAKLVTGDLAPQPGSPVHYDSFLDRLCRLYQERFGTIED
jgi:hypothetical protein